MKYSNQQLKNIGRLLEIMKLHANKVMKLK